MHNIVYIIIYKMNLGLIQALASSINFSDFNS